MLIAVGHGRGQALVSGTSQLSQAAEIEVLRSELNDPDKKLYATYRLLELNDEETVDQEIDEYHRYANNIGDLTMHGRELVISKLMADVMGSSNGAFGGDVPAGLGIRDLSTVIVLKAIGNSDSFPEKTREWAKDLAGSAQPPISPQSEAFVKQMMRQHGITPPDHLPEHPTYEMAANWTREWWQHNANAVLSRRCASADWLPDEGKYSNVPGMPTPFPHASEAAVENLAVPTPLASSPIGPLAGTDSGAFVWAYALGAIAVGGLAGIGIWYFRQGK